MKNIKKVFKGLVFGILAIAFITSGLLVGGSAVQATSTPVTTLISPIGGASVAGPNVSFHFQITGQAIPAMMCYQYIDNVNVSINTVGAIIPLNTIDATWNGTVTLGSHTWRMDCGGTLASPQMTSSTETFTVQDPPPPPAPTINLLSPAADAQVNIPVGSVTFSFQVPNGVHYPMICDLYIDGNQIVSNGFWDLSTSGSLPATASVGAHNWKITCDDGGNIRTSETRNFTFSTDPAIAVHLSPLGTVTQWNGGTFTNNSNPTYNWTATDTAATTISCQAYTDNKIDGPAIVHAPGSFSTTSVFAPFADATPNPQPGDPTLHQIKVVCTDTAGNSGTSYMNFRVDTVPPVVSILGAPASPTTTPTHIYAQCIDNNGSGPSGECAGSWDFWAFIRGAQQDPTLSPPYKTKTFTSNPGTCPTDPSVYTGPSDVVDTAHVWFCAYATDAAGNAGFSSPTEVKVTAPPIITPTLTIGSTTAANGAHISIPITVSDFGNNVNSAELLVNYDPALLTITSVTPNASLPDPLINPNYAPDTIFVNYMAPVNQTFSLNNGDTIATLNFTVIGNTNTTTNLAFKTTATPQTTKSELLDVLGTVIPANFVGGTVTINNSEVQNHTISGAVKYYDGVKVIPGATVILENGGGTTITTATTDSNGAYQFTDVPDGGNYITLVTDSDTSTTGLSSADQIKIGRHIAGLEIFDSIYKVIAGDVNNSGTLTSADQIKIGRFIAGLDSVLPSGTWKFYSSDAVLNASNYLTTGLTRTYTNLTTNPTGQNFVGIKMGDVNNSWTSN